MNGVSRFLDRGGNAVVLSGNTAFWRVSFNADASIIECRKGDAPGTQVRADRRGEMWHSHDGRRGGMSRECGFPAWRLFGLEYFSLVGVGTPGVGPYKVTQSRPLPLSPAQRSETAHRGRVSAARRDVRCRSRSATRGTRACRRSPGSSLIRLPTGERSRPKIPPVSRSWPKGLPIRGRSRSPGITSSGRFLSPRTPPISVAAEMIYWERPEGGRVFHAGSINAGSTLAVDEKWSGLLHNVLSHFGVSHA